MADLTDLEAAQTVKITGATNSGETSFVNSFNSQLQSADLINTTSTQTTLSVSTTAQECKVGGSTLANRKLLLIQVQGSGFVYGFSSGSQPFDLPNGSTLSLALGPNISVWVRKASGTANVAVAELS